MTIGTLGRIFLFFGGASWLYVGFFAVATAHARRNGKYLAGGLAAIGCGLGFLTKLRALPVWLELGWYAGGLVAGVVALVVVVAHQMQTGRWRG